MSHFSLWDIKKRASSHEPLASVRKAFKAFLLNCIIVTYKSIFFLPKIKLLITYKNKLSLLPFIPNYLFS